MGDLAARGRELFRFFLAWIFCRWILLWGAGSAVLFLLFSGYALWSLLSRKPARDWRSVTYGLIAAYFAAAYLFMLSMGSREPLNFFQASRIMAIEEILAAAFAGVLALSAFGKGGKTAYPWRNAAIWIFPCADLAWSAMFGDPLRGGADPLLLLSVIVAYCGILIISREDGPLPERLDNALSSRWALPTLLIAGFFISMRRLGAIGLDNEIYWVLQSFRGVPAGCFADSWKGNYQFFGNFLPALSYSFDSVFGSGARSIYALFSAISVISLFALHLLARKLYGRRAAAFLIPVIIISPFFPLATALAKEISVQALLSMLALLMYLAWREKKDSALPALMAGLFSGLGIMNKMLFVPFLAALLLYALISERRIRPLVAAVFSIGLLAGSFPYAYYLAVKGGDGAFLSAVISQVGAPARAGAYNLLNLPLNILTRVNELSAYSLYPKEYLGAPPPSFRSLETVGPLWAICIVAFGALLLFQKARKSGQDIVPVLSIFFLIFSTVSYNDIFPLHFASVSFLIFLLFAQLLILSADTAGIARGFGAFVICAALFLPVLAILPGTPGREGLMEYSRVREIAEREGVSSVYSASCTLGYGLGYHFSFTGTEVGAITNSSDIDRAFSGGRLLFIRPIEHVANVSMAGYDLEEVRGSVGLSDELLRSAAERGIPVRAVPSYSPYAESYIVG